ncbi:hypothetical protein Acor_30320 [Acrocarpospora corrugata]|uniref:Uncharacterized protein n=1 Tax=Acrocarpospora corrugata TaxID=35763 RepID=A0A5M3W2Y6_9ACTN|nr:hypothetical protein Acor_30320 [Acrocarpospora corrugata]
MHDGAVRPRGGDQRPAADDLAGTGRQRCEQPELDGGEPDGPLSFGDGVAGGVEPEPRRGRGRDGPPGEGVQADDEFGEREGLDQVVVRSGAEAGQQIVQAVARGEQEDRGLHAALPQGQHHVTSIGVRQADRHAGRHAATLASGG